MMGFAWGTGGLTRAARRHARRPPRHRADAHADGPDAARRRGLRARAAGEAGAVSTTPDSVRDVRELGAHGREVRCLGAESAGPMARTGHRDRLWYDPRYRSPER